MNNGLEKLQSLLEPAHILYGLGGAERSLLATCIALFEDSTLARRVENLYREFEGFGLKRFTKESDANSAQNAKSVRDTQEKWLSSDLSDDNLRLVLWIQLREALELPPRLSATHRGCTHLADDLTAKLISYLDPPGAIKSGKRWLCQKGWLSTDQQATRLSDIVLPILDELLESAQTSEDSPINRDIRREKLADALFSLSTLSKQDRELILSQTGVNDTNDEAIRRAFIIGGSLSAFGIGVSTAGFSSYILAAQASAFIPLVTGPGLVSFVSVISNPISIIAATGGGAWWLARSARQKANVSIASRIVAMLVIQGLQTGISGLDRISRSFRHLPSVIFNEKLNHLLSREKRDLWDKEWQTLRAIWGTDTGSKPTEKIMAFMETVVEDDAPVPWQTVVRNTSAGNEKVNAGAFSILTVGEILYSAAAIDPQVIRAADFSRVAEIDGRIEFSQLASEILGGSEHAMRGSISQLKGYVAERAVAADLVSSGHTVSFPETSNESGFDLIVDGQPFQVKFHESLSGIRDHFSNYDYPVFANAELVGKIPGDLADQVFFIEGLSSEVITHLTETSLDAADQMLNSSYMASAAAISIARGLIAYRGGSLTRHQLIEQVLLDGAVRVGLAGSGAVLGSAVGLFAFGPAGAWFFGAGAPILAAMQTSKATSWIKGLVRSEQHQLWERAMHASLDALQTRVLQALRNKTELVQSKIAEAPANDAGYYLKWRLEDDIYFAQECHERISLITKASSQAPEQRVSKLLREVSNCSIHPSIYSTEMRTVTRCLSERPGLRELFDPRKFEDAYSQSKKHLDHGRQWFKNKTR